MMYLRGYFPYCQHLVDLVEKARGTGVSRWIVFPFLTSLAANLSEVRNGNIEYSYELEQVPYAWENRRLMEEIYELFPEEGAQTLPFVIVDPIRETHAQAAALCQLRQEYSFHGIKLQTTVIKAPIKGLLNEGKVILELAEEWDLPLLIHSSVLPLDIWAQASDILDVAEATPGVRFCLAHSLRFDREQLDRLAAMPNCWFDCSAHRIHCMLAVKDNPSVAPKVRRFQSDYKRPDRVLRDLAEAYPDKLMWGTDSPAFSWLANIDGERSELLSSYEEEVACLEALTPAQRTINCKRNTLDFLKLKNAGMVNQRPMSFCNRARFSKRISR